MTSTEDERLADLFGKQAAHSEHSRGERIRYRSTAAESVSATDCLVKGSTRASSYGVPPKARWTGNTSTSTTLWRETGRVTRFLISCFRWTCSNNGPPSGLTVAGSSCSLRSYKGLPSVRGMGRAGSRDLPSSRKEPVRGVCGRCLSLLTETHKSGYSIVG